VLQPWSFWRPCARFPFFTFLVNIVGSIGLALTTVSIGL
jgi:fluoride ion exporter CrcB/FEX